VGIRAGDVIARIDGEDAKGWTNEQAMTRLRGAKGMPVQIHIRRRGYTELIPLKVVRDEVHIATVQSSFMFDDVTGYVHLKDFGENSEREVETALDRLKDKGMKRLVLDLRSNPGGPLDQAIKISNLFLPRGRMIVGTKGRVSNSDQDYRGQRDGEFLSMPIVVITNRESASASEIVAGALQDHDRAYIVGETTFGKALVQSVYKISGGAGLALTTAHYYTPSGRLIQRPWDASFDEYLNYRLRDQDAKKTHSPADLKRTQAGRPVYSGGGIEPDKHLTGPVEGFNPGRFGRLLYGRGAFEAYAVKYMAEGDTRVEQQATGRNRVSPNFVVTDAIVDDFRDFLKSERFIVEDAAFSSDLPFIRAMIRFRIDEAVFNMAEARRHLLAVDPQAQLALSSFGEAEKLLGLNKGAGKAH
jgi:carboxyl-terminal processing protease